MIRQLFLRLSVAGIALASIGFTPSSRTWAQSTGAATAPDSLVTARLLRRACLAAVDANGDEQDTTAAVAILAAYCRTPSDGRLETARIPTVATIFEAAKRPLLAVSSMLDTAPFERSIQQYGAAGGTQDATGIPAFGSRPWQSLFLFGLERVIEARVEEQIRAIGWEKARERLCTNYPTAQVFSQTCDVLTRSETSFSTTLAGGMLHAAAKADARLLPVNLLSATLVSSRLEQTNHLVAARGAMSIALDLSEGRSVEGSLVKLAYLPLPDSATWNHSDVSMWIGLIGLYAAVSEVDGDGERSKGPRRLELAYSIRALMIDVNGAKPIRVLSGDSKVCDVVDCLQVVELEKSTAQAVQALAELDALRRLAAQESDAERRRELRSEIVLLAYRRAASLIENAVPGWWPTTQARHFDRVASIAAAMISENFSEAAVAAIQFTDELARGNKVDARVVRATAFLAAISDANDAESMDAAMGAFIAPADRFSRKRSSDAKPYLMLNAYLGLAAGLERGCEGTTRCSKLSAIGAVAMPIAIEAGTPIGSGFSLGIALQFLDLGAITAWRFSTAYEDANGVRVEPEIGFAQVFSPGAHIVLGLPGPLAVGIGGTFTPKLRSLRDGVGEKRTAVRFPAIFFAFDVPLFP